MKKTAPLFLTVVFISLSMVLFAQSQQRTRTIPDEKARQIIENALPYEGTTDGTRGGGNPVYIEHFDDTGGTLPAGWSVSGNSSVCTWAVDATPKPPGYRTASYSLNYNNGADYDCGDNYGYVRSPLIEVGGCQYNISFWWSHLNECTFGTCPWDVFSVTIYDEYDNFIVSYELPATNSAWYYANIQQINVAGVDKIYAEFSFFTYDEILNDYHGPFIDNFEVYVNTANVPLSNWAIAAGILLILTATVLRLRKTG